MDLMTVFCPGGNRGHIERRGKGIGAILSRTRKEKGSEIGLGGRGEEDEGVLKTEQGRRVSRRNGSLSMNLLCGCQACDRKAMWKSSAVKGRKLEVMHSGSKRVSGFDAPEWVVTKDCQSWDCGAAGRHHSELTPLLWLPELMQGLGSIIFISVSFFKQPVADDF